MALPIRKRSSSPGLFPASLENQFNQLQHEVNRMMQAFSPQEPMSVGAWSPEVDIYEDEKGIRLRADLPGLESKDLNISVEDNVLTVSGKREESKEEKKENYLRRERYYGEFTRSFSLPEYADADKIDASFKNGVLEVTVPAKPETKRKAKHIEVKPS